MVAAVAAVVMVVAAAPVVASPTPVRGEHGNVGVGPLVFLRGVVLGASEAVGFEALNEEDVRAGEVEVDCARESELANQFSYGE